MYNRIAVIKTKVFIEVCDEITVKVPTKVQVWLVSHSKSSMQAYSKELMLLAAAKSKETPIKISEKARLVSKSLL